MSRLAGGCTSGFSAFTSAQTDVAIESIRDPTFRYTPGFSTDIRKTFARIRDELRRRGGSRAPGAEPLPRLTPLLRRQPQS